MDFKKNLFWGIPFIVVGIVWTLDNIGVINHLVYEIVLSWQMLIWYLGVSWICRKHYKIGITAFLLGAIFLVPKLGWMNAYLNRETFETLWPVILVFIGLLLIFVPRKKKACFRERNVGVDAGNIPVDGAKSDFTNTNGYVVSDSTFGYVEQIILEPYFKGAQIKVLFGGTVLDLRKTKLEGSKTYIDLSCTFAGLEIYLPNDWKVDFRASTLCGGCEDGRYNATMEMDQEHVLVIRGNIAFGGIEIKS